MTSSPTGAVILRDRARARRRNNRRITFILIHRSVDRALTHFFWAHQTPMVLLATIMAGVIIGVTVRVLFSVGGI